jgi:nitroreductase
MEIINKRRSVRSFQPTPVEKEKLELLLRAAMQAPSAGNQQPWEFVVVTNAEIREALSQMSPYSKSLANAPAAIVVLGNCNYLRFAENMEQDLGAATENLLLEAVELGLGTTWLGVYPLEDRVAHVSKTLNLPDHVIPYCAIPVGYPKDGNANKFVDRYDEKRVHFETYAK